MKKAILSLILLLAGVSVYAQPAFGTKVYRDSNGIVLLKGDDGSWVILQGTGAPTLTTYIGESVPNKALYFNTSTAGAYSYSNGTWTLSSAGSASAIAPTTTAVTGCTSEFLVADSGGLLQCPTSVAAFTGGAGGGVLTFRDTMSGASATNNFLNVTGTLPAVLTNSAYGVFLDFTSAGSSASLQGGMEAILRAGYTGAVRTEAGFFQNLAAGTSIDYTSTSGNMSVWGSTVSTTTGANVGAKGLAQGGDISVGVVGRANVAKNAATNIGGLFLGRNTGSTPIAVGVYAGMNTTSPTLTGVNTALLADNSDQAVPIFLARDNGTVVDQIRDGGTIAGKDAVAGTDTDTAGGALTIGGGTGTGTGKGGSLVLQTTPSTTTGTTSLTPYDRVTFAAKAVALTDAATILFTVNTLGAHKRSGGTLEFTVQASDGTNDQVATGRTYWGAVDTTAGAGGETCTNLVDGLTISAAASGAASSGTLVITADATTGTDLCNFRITPAGSLTETTYNVYYWITKNLPDGAVSLP